MINLFKEKDIERGLTLEEFLVWCELYNKPKIVNIKSSEECTKKEILEYSSKLNQTHNKIMSSKSYINNTVKMFKCMTCDHASEVSKGVVSPGGTQEYIVTCRKENVCVMVNWDAHVSDLPCWENKIL